MKPMVSVRKGGKIMVFREWLKFFFGWGIILVSGVQYSLWFDICINCEMITTLLSPYRVIFFLVMRIFKIYSLSSFQVCNMVLLTIVIMLYLISPWLILYLEVCTFWLSSFLPPTHFWQPPICSFCSLLGMSLVLCVCFVFVLFLFFLRFCM